MRKPGRPRDDSHLPPQRETAQRAREAELFAALGALADTEGLAREIEAEMRIVRSNREAVKKSAIDAAHRDLLVKQSQLRLERIRTLIKLKG